MRLTEFCSSNVDVSPVHTCPGALGSACMFCGAFNTTLLILRLCERYISLQATKAVVLA